MQEELQWQNRLRELLETWALLYQLFSYLPGCISMSLEYKREKENILLCIYSGHMYQNAQCSVKQVTTKIHIRIMPWLPPYHLN